LRTLGDWLLFLVLIILWGFNWPAMKTALEFVEPFTFIADRYILSAVTLIPVLIIYWKKIPKDAKHIASLLISIIINISVMIFTISGLTNEGSGISSLLMYTQPLFVFCLSVFFLKETVRITRIAGVIIGFSGMILLSTSRFNGVTPNYSVLLLGIGAFLWAVSIVFYKKYLSDIDPIITNTLQLIVGSIAVTLFSFITGRSYLVFSQDYLPAILYVSIGATSIGFSIWTFLLKDEEPTVLSFSSLIIPVTAVIFSWLLFGESLGYASLLAASLVITGLYLVNK
jgi:drug/metabolite transporter (DMT)-like permease